MRALLLSLIALAGCDGLFSGNCTAEAEPAVVVTVLSDGGPPATGTISDGGDTETLDAFQVSDGTETLSGGYERAGTYDIRIEKAGYAPWARDGVRVPAGDCGPQTVRLEARLEPL